MRTNIPHNVITISEMNRNPCRIRHENILLEELTLDSTTVKKLRASSSMFNKSVFLKIIENYKKFNVESVHMSKKLYKIMLISSDSRIELHGRENEAPRIVKRTAID